MKKCDGRNLSRFSFVLVISIFTAFCPVYAEGTVLQSVEANIRGYNLAVEINPDFHSFGVISSIDLNAVKGIEKVSFAFNKELAIKRITVNGKETDFAQRDNELVIHLGNRVEADTPFRIAVEYDGTTEDKKEGFKWGDIGDVTYMIYESLWYPTIYGSRAPARIEIAVPIDYVAISSGDLIEVREKDGKKIFVWQSGDSPYGISFAAGRYKIKALDFAANVKSATPIIQISCYLLEKDFYMADGCLRTSKNMLEFYMAQFDGYPFTSFSVVEMPEDFFGGHGDQGFILLQSNVLRSGNEEFVAHEIAHTWWGAMISAEGGYNLLPFGGLKIASPRESSKNHWLNEGFATYSSMLFLENKYGRGTMLQTLKEKRREYLQVDEDTPIAQAKEDYGSDDYHAIVYSKGALVIHMLRYVVGEDDFKKILDAYIQRFKGKSATVQEFKMVSEEVYGDLDWFFDSWIATTSIPDYAVGSVMVEPCAGGYCTKVEVVQKGNLVKMPVDVFLRTSSSNESKRAFVEGERAYVEFVSTDEPLAVELDPDYWILEGERANNIKVLRHLSIAGLKALFNSLIYRLD